LKFVLANPLVSAVIPGARNPKQAEANGAASEGAPLKPPQVEAARQMWEQDEYLRNMRTGL